MEEENIGSQDSQRYVVTEDEPDKEEEEEEEEKKENMEQEFRCNHQAARKEN
jgi:hypothetical protein